MIIDCPKCKKKFQLDESLIPEDGRVLQCGSCNNKWFFKFKNVNDNQNQLKKKEILVEEKVTNYEEKPTLSENIIKEDNGHNNIKKNNIKKDNINYFKVILVFTISFIALIIILDTFKNHLTLVFPGIKIVLNNLYQTLYDIKLFSLDLFR